MRTIVYHVAALCGLWLLWALSCGAQNSKEGAQSPQGANRDQTLTAHSKSVNAVVFSPDSKRLVTGSADGTAMVWEVATGRNLLTLKGTTAAISSVLYTPNGKFILTGCTDGTVHIWDATTGEQKRTLASPGGGVCALDVTADGAKILGGYDNGKVKLWNIATGQGLNTFDYDNLLFSVAISEDGKRIAAGYMDATVKVWDLQAQHSLFSVKMPESEGITGLRFDKDNMLLTWDREESKDGKSKFSVMTAWDTKSSKKAGSVRFPIPESTISNVVSYETFSMLFGLFEGQAILYLPEGKEHVSVTLDAHDGIVAAVAISPDGTTAATGGTRKGKGEAKLWDIKAHTPAKKPK